MKLFAGSGLPKWKFFTHTTMSSWRRLRSSALNSGVSLSRKNTMRLEMACCNSVGNFRNFLIQTPKGRLLEMRCGAAAGKFIWLPPGISMVPICHIEEVH